jgi:hypothetical protein
VRLKMEQFGSGGILAGSLPGKRAFAGLVGMTEVPSKPEVCFLDFAGVVVVTTSFLRDSVVAYRNHARSAWPYLYPVAANLGPAVREEFEIWLAETSDIFVICDLDDGDRPSNVTMLGQIDGKQLVALRGVIDLGETDVSGLAAHVGEEVAPTAWNNRIGSLLAKGLVIEVSNTGRNKRYRPILEGIRYGT